MEVPRRVECLAAIRAALEAGEYVNARNEYGWTPLQQAAGFNNDVAAVKAAAELLLTAGADVRAKHDAGGEPLHAAVRNNDAEAGAAAVQALLEAGADALAKDNAWH